MARFNYTAEKSSGEIYKGAAEAQDRFELYQVVRREGGKIISVTEEKSTDVWSLQYWSVKLRGISEYEKILFARNLGAMLAAGLALSRALAVQERQTHNPKLASVINSLSEEVRKGGTMHDALAKFPHVFSKLFVAMVRAGEEGGDLAQSLQVVADQMERLHSLKKKIHGALMYPAVIVVAILAIGTLMMTRVVPTLAATFTEMGAELPASTQAVIAVSNFITDYTPLAILGVIALGVGMYTMAKTVSGRRFRDWLFLHVPLIREIVREVNAARASRTLSSLLSSGVDVMTTLDITAEVVQNSYFREVVVSAKDSVGRGEPLSLSFTRRTDLYPPFVGEMLSVGEETGQTNEMLKRLALFYEEEVDRKTKDMSTIIEPFLMVIIGVVVGFFAISMISPIYQLSSNI